MKPFVDELATLLNVSQEEVNAVAAEDDENLCATAYHLYERGDYPIAAQFFTKLVLANPFDEKYWRGLASSRQMQGEYLASVYAWSMVALIEHKDPMPHYHAAECLLSLNEKTDALKALTAAESLLDEKNQAIRHKINLLKQVHFNVH